MERLLNAGGYYFLAAKVIDEFSTIFVSVVAVVCTQIRGEKKFPSLIDVMQWTAKMMFLRQKLCRTKMMTTSIKGKHIGISSEKKEFLDYM